MNDALGTSKSSQAAPSDEIIRFGSFEVDLHSGELRKSGLRVKFGGQPFDVLVTLLEKPGQVVTREELHDKLWSQDTFVDFEHGLNKAINKVREALGDDADNPRFIETIPRRGYRFLAPVVNRVSEEAAIASPVSANEQNASTIPLAARANLLRRVWLWTSAAALILIGGAAVVVSTPPRPPRVLRYTQLTHDGLNKIDPPVTDGSSIYFGEQDSQQHNIIARVSVSGGQVSTLTTFPGDPVSALDYSSARSELLIGLTIGESPVWALSLPGGSTPRRVGNFVTDDAVWSADGESIVYSRLNELVEIKADGTDPRKIATVPGLAGRPRLSPDGKSWRFTLFSSCNLAPTANSLWQVAADGSNLHSLFPNWRDRNDFAGSWTPDGKYFIFASSPGPVGGSIFAIREKKGWFERRAPQPIELTAGPLSFSAPILSTDGKQIFSAGYLARGELLRYDAGIRNWTPYLSGISAADLDFSKDGEWVTYVLVPEGTLWRSRADGSERLQLTISPMRTAMPRWSSDGKTIAFMGLKPKGVWTIYTVAADGGEAEQLFADNKYAGDPNWSPDGSRLVYGRFAIAPDGIHVLDLRSRRVSDLPGSDGLFSPRWSPDGQFILALTANNLPSARSQLQPRPIRLMRFDLAAQKWRKVWEAGSIAYPSLSRNGKYVYFYDYNVSKFFRLDLASHKVEKIAGIDAPLVMKQDDIFLWTGLTPDGSPMFLRDTSTPEIYALDVDFP